MGRFKKTSIYDCVALAIAKCRNIILLTGDGSLRKAAQFEGVTVMGTIGVLDKLYDGAYIESVEYLECLEKLKAYNGGKIRLPKKEVEKRITNVKKKL